MCEHFLPMDTELTGVESVDTEGGPIASPSIPTTTKQLNRVLLETGIINFIYLAPFTTSSCTL